MTNREDPRAKEVPSAQKNSSNGVFLDVKLLALYQAVVFLAFFVPRVNPLQKLSAVCVILILSGSVAAYSRYRRGWRWPGANATRVFWAVAAVVGFTMIATGGRVRELDSDLLKNLAAAFGGIAFLALWFLRIVYLDKRSFLADCAGSSGAALDPAVVASKYLNFRTRAAAARVIAILLIILYGAYVTRSHSDLIRSIRHASPVSTVDHAAPYNDHGTRIYVTRAERDGIDRAHAVIGYFWLSLCMAVLVVRFIFKINIFDRDLMLTRLDDSLVKREE